MRNNKKEEFVSMSDVLKDFKSQNKLSKGFLKVDVDAAWKEVMGPGVMTYTTGIKLSEEKLFIDLSSSVLRQELSYGRSKIIANLNEHLGKEVIKTLVLR
ncbi:RNA-binding protein [Nonlabens sp. YIK11]|uniref:DUF721 domain-containing protein n=1 Tax=Nonlabens sp. YIK11 TaxID=1453349 RepID=UPI0006DC3DC8|nr:DUF721 domain-containing protein [Nonlabens sp. YIK11]KQC33271.1 RNA-binding protein [Nonlabens sp. YIK11]